MDESYTRASSEKADEAWVTYIIDNHISFNSSDSDTCKTLVKAIQNAPSSWKPPNRKRSSTEILDTLYSHREAEFDKSVSDCANQNRGITLTSDGITVHGDPLTNVVAMLPNCKTPCLIDFDDALEHLQTEGATKDANYIANVVTRGIERVGPSNVAHFVSDCAAVMVAAWLLLSISFSFIFFSGCICHRTNTLMKHIINDVDHVADIVRRGKAIVIHLKSHQKSAALVEKFSLEHLKVALTFVIPSDTRMGLYLLMLHRLLRLRPAIISTVNSATYINDHLQNEEVDNDVNDNTFWSDTLALVQYLYPFLRLIRLADSDDNYIGKVAPRVKLILNHVKENKHLVQCGDEIVAIVEEHTVGMVMEIHLAAYCLDPEFWNDDTFSNAVAVAALKSALRKVFHRFANVNEKVSLAWREFIEYKGKQGLWALPGIAEEMKETSASEFWRTACAFSPELRYAAIWILEQKCSNSAAERDWKDYKLNSTKTRSLLEPERVKKMIKIANGIKIQQADEAGWRPELKRFTEADEMCKLDAVLVAAAAVVPLRFKNYIQLEDEFPALKTKCDASERLLKHKYSLIYFKDPEVEGGVEVRRVVDVEWKIMRPARDSQYNLVTQLVERDGIIDHDDELIGYIINDELHDMIRGADSHNKNYVLERQPEPFNFE